MTLDAAHDQSEFTDLCERLAAEHSLVQTCRGGVQKRNAYTRDVDHRLIWSGRVPAYKSITGVKQGEEAIAAFLDRINHTNASDSHGST